MNSFIVEITISFLKFTFRIEQQMKEHVLLEIPESETIQEAEEVAMPQAKRQRVGSDGECLPKSVDNSNDSEKILLDLADVYRHLGVALAQDKKSHDALHCFRISLQLNTSKFTFIHCFEYRR